MELPLIEIGGALLMGGGLGLVLDRIMCRMKVQHDAMAVSMGFVLLGVGLSEAFGFSLILASMIMGMVVVNRCADHGRHWEPWSSMSSRLLLLWCRSWAQSR